jgi:magnesium-transporting ATPase (P-type)
MSDIEGGPKESENQDIATPADVAKPQAAAKPPAASDANITVDPHEVGHIDAIRRVSEIRVQNKNATNEEKLAENIYIDTIRRVSGVTMADMKAQETGRITAKRVASENIIIRNKGTSFSPVDRIKVEHKLTSSEIGVIEAVRRISGVNAALHELGSSANLKKDIVAVSVQHGGNLGIEKPKGAKAAGGKSTNATSGLGDKDWHLLPEEDLFRELKTRKNGLSTEERARKLEEFGPNLITPPKKTHWLIKFLFTLIGGFQLMMWIGAILCFVVYGISNATDVQTLALAIVLVLVVLLTSIFQEVQESKSDNVMAALKELTADTVRIVLNGEEVVVPAESLVPGDIVNVKLGEKVPADLRILVSSDLKVNNASLTGENVDIKLGKDANHELLYEAKNIARSGCNFTCGNGTGVVFATGDNTFFGNIAKSTTTIERPDTLMKHEIHRLINIMAIVAFTLGITFFILAFFNGYSWIEAVVFMIGIVVANVPEGLLPQMTVALSLTAQRLTNKGVVVTNLEIIETLGAVDVICSDKTGTLTCNRMTVSHVVYDKQIHITPITPQHGRRHFRQLRRGQRPFQSFTTYCYTKY